MSLRQNSRISIQVSLSGYSYLLEENGKTTHSGWLRADRLFTTQEFQRRYDEVEISLLTPKATLLPQHFFNPSSARQALAEVVALRDSDAVEYVDVPSLGAVMVYSNSIDESLSKVISQTVCDSDGNSVKVLPELYWLLQKMNDCDEYNKILASYMDGYLHLVIAQGKSLLLANVFEAVDFTTAQYFLFLALKNLQLNPEVSTIWFRTPLSNEQEMSLYRYFKAVEVI
ncbi:MAG: DUF3822 family protein [Bacteroidales bacterium]|nr:DUF3822 family protein [Bacteroidales bacterium]